MAAGIFGCDQQRLTNTLTAAGRCNREGVEPCQSGTTPQQHQGVTEQRAIALRHQKHPIVCLYPVAQPAPAQAVAAEAGLFQLCEGIDIGLGRGSQLQVCGYPGGGFGGEFARHGGENHRGRTPQQRGPAKLANR